MAGDRATEVEKTAQPPAAEQSSLFGHVMEHIKHGAAKVRDTTVDLVHKGEKKGDELIHHPTTKKIVGDVVDAGKGALHKGREVAEHPTTKKIIGEVEVAGKQVGQDHPNRVNGVIAAGKNGDLHGVIQNGLPLASEVLMGPGAAALLIAKDKGAKIAIEHATPEQREALRQLKKATDVVTMPPANVPNLIITGKH